jgi:hypothetical protein
MKSSQFNTQTIAENLKASFKDLKVEIKADEVFASAKSLTLSSNEILTLAHITKGLAITFGRTGPNFRMIISKN